MGDSEGGGLVLLLGGVEGFFRRGVWVVGFGGSFGARMLFVLGWS